MSSGHPVLDELHYTQDSVARMAKDRAVPDNQCYVYNFDDPDWPLVISLPAGSGIQFQRKMETLLIDIQREMQSTFSGEVYEKGKRMILEQYRAQVAKIWDEAEAFAADLSFKIERTPTGINTYPLLFGKPMEQLPLKICPENKEILKDKEKQIEGKVQETVYQMGKVNEELGKAMEQFMRETSAKAIEGLFLPLKESYKDNEKVLSYLDAYLYDAVEHFSIFLPDDEADSDENIMRSLIGSKEQQTSPLHS